MSLNPSSVASLFIFGTFFHAASAALVVYQGGDGTATDKSQLVNSAAAQASFASAVGGGLVVEPLESAPIGLHQATWSVGGLNYARFLGDDSGILNAPNKGRFATSGNVFAYTNGNGSFFTFNGNVDAF